MGSWLHCTCKLHAVLSHLQQPWLHSLYTVGHYGGALHTHTDLWICIWCLILWVRLLHTTYNAYFNFWSITTCRLTTCRLATCRLATYTTHVIEHPSLAWLTLTERGGLRVGRTRLIHYSSTLGYCSLLNSMYNCIIKIYLSFALLYVWHYGYLPLRYRRRRETISIRASDVGDHDVWDPETPEDGEPVM